jgi:hypothetical protein
MAEAFICDYVRTPIGRFGGALAAVRADDLAAVPLKTLMARHEDLDWAAVNDVVLGCANQAGEDNRNVARMALLLAGLPDEVPGTTVNRLCGSGMDRRRMVVHYVNPLFRFMDGCAEIAQRFDADFTSSVRRRRCSSGPAPNQTNSRKRSERRA